MAADTVLAIEGLVLDGVRVSFSGAAQPYWSTTTCVNTTHAGFPVTVVGGSCALPASGR